jgi:hypothetical protein
MLISASPDDPAISTSGIRTVIACFAMLGSPSRTPIDAIAVLRVAKAAFPEQLPSAVLVRRGRAGAKIEQLERHHALLSDHGDTGRQRERGRDLFSGLDLIRLVVTGLVGVELLRGQRSLEIVTRYDLISALLTHSAREIVRQTVEDGGSKRSASVLKGRRRLGLGLAVRPRSEPKRTRSTEHTQCSNQLSCVQPAHHPV